jgi:hypothetical protein
MIKYKNLGPITSKKNGFFFYFLIFLKYISSILCCIRLKKNVNNLILVNLPYVYS